MYPRLLPSCALAGLLLAGPAAAKDGPPDKLVLGFSTADVVVTGWRLEQLADEVREHKGGIIKTLPNAVRYEQLQPNACAVASISVKPISKA